LFSIGIFVLLAGLSASLPVGAHRKVGSRIGICFPRRSHAAGLQLPPQRHARFRAAVTDLALNPENERHRFVRDTLRDTGIEPVAREGFAVGVARLKPLLQ
jgi:hypothetical protein